MFSAMKITSVWIWFGWIWRCGGICGLNNSNILQRLKLLQLFLSQDNLFARWRLNYELTPGWRCRSCCRRLLLSDYGLTVVGKDVLPATDWHYGRGCGCDRWWRYSRLWVDNNSKKTTTQNWMLKHQQWVSFGCLKDCRNLTQKSKTFKFNWSNVFSAHRAWSRDWRNFFLCTTIE